MPNNTFVPVDFPAVNRAALARLPDILARWLPGGRIEGREYVVKNPKRRDQRPGSFTNFRSIRSALIWPAGPARKAATESMMELGPTRASVWSRRWQIE